jgi:DNA helicase HerA-like ATPase
MPADIGLHVTDKGADRGLIVGETGTGKSTLAKGILEIFRSENLPKGRLLICDTKPRWRATRTIGGDTIAKRYKRMVKGDKIDSMILDRPSDWPIVWDRNVNPSRTVILQPPTNNDYNEDAEIRRQVWAIGKFFRTLDPKEPSFLYIDEGMDFFGPTGTAKHGTIIQRCYRAGRERGLITCMGTQRPACITVQAMSESNVKYILALGTESDFDTLRKKGIPREVRPVKADYHFRLIRDREVYPKLLTYRP